MLWIRPKKGILIQAELEVMNENIDHYETLNQELAHSINEIKQTLLPVEQENSLISTTYSESQKETQILKEKLENRRGTKKNNIPNMHDRIKRIQEGKRDNIFHQQDNYSRQNKREHQYSTNQLRYGQHSNYQIHSEHTYLRERFNPPRLQLQPLMREDWDPPAF